MSLEVPENLVLIKRIDSEWVSLGDNYPLSAFLRTKTLRELIQKLKGIGYERFYILTRREQK